MGQTAGRSRFQALVAALAVVLVGAACGGGRDGGGATVDTTTSTTRPPAAEASTSTTTTTAPMTDEEAVLAALDGYWDAWIEANDPPAPGHPGLERYATGLALETALGAIENNQAFGYSLRLPEPTVSATEVQIVEVDGDTARVVACEIDDGLKLRSDTGAVVNDQVVSRLAEYRILRVEGSWKVERSDFLRTEEGGGGCGSW